MAISRPAQRLTASLIVICLLLAQVAGLHHHRHLDLDHDQSGHGSALHFVDVGHHWNVTDSGHDRDEQVPAAHAHVDVETKAVADGLIKAFADSLPLGLVFVVLFMLWLPLPRAPLLRSVINPLWRGPPRYGLPPPSQAPPVGFSLSC